MAKKNITPTSGHKSEITNVLILVDASGSMDSYWAETKNQLVYAIQTLQTQAQAHKQETRLTLHTFSDYLNAPIFQDKPIELVSTGELRSLRTQSATALWDSLHTAVKQVHVIASHRNVYAKNVYLVNIITDGENNRGLCSFADGDLARAPEWTFTAACPPGKRRGFASSGFDIENVTEWEGTVRGAIDLGQNNVKAFSNYMTLRSAGLTKSSTFYADASAVTAKTLRDLTHLSGRPLEVSKETTIRPFVEDHTNKPYVLGSAFYRLEKTEKLQASKSILLWHKKDKQLYGDSHKATVRDILGLQSNGEIRVTPGNHGDYDIFVQSGSVNRILPRNTKVVVLT